MNDEIEENDLNIIKDEKICPFCKMLISSNLIQDHILCHELNNEEDKIDNMGNNDTPESEQENKNSENDDDNFGSKFFGFFKNIGNKTKDIFKKEGKDDINLDKFKIKGENLKKISSFFNNMTDKISQKFDEIKEKIKNKFDDNDSDSNDTPISINLNNNRNDDNIDDLLFRFEEEDNNINNKRENLFKDSDVNEILRYLPTSTIQEEKTKNDNNYKCVICLYEFKIGDKVCTLPCLHIFHINCLKNWIVRDRWCPICKYDFSLDSLLTDNIIDNI